MNSEGTGDGEEGIGKERIKEDVEDEMKGRKSRGEGKRQGDKNIDNTV